MFWKPPHPGAELPDSLHGSSTTVILAAPTSTCCADYVVFCGSFIVGGVIYREVLICWELALTEDGYNVFTIDIGICYFWHNLVIYVWYIVYI